jgi:hypothetical protein
MSDTIFVLLILAGAVALLACAIGALVAIAAAVYRWWNRSRLGEESLWQIVRDEELARYRLGYQPPHWPLTNGHHDDDETLVP